MQFGSPLKFTYISSFQNKEVWLLGKGRPAHVSQPLSTPVPSRGSLRCSVDKKIPFPPPWGSWQAQSWQQQPPVFCEPKRKGNLYKSGPHGKQFSLFFFSPYLVVQMQFQKWPKTDGQVNSRLREDEGKNGLWAWWALDGASQGIGSWEDDGETQAQLAAKS